MLPRRLFLKSSAVAMFGTGIAPAWLTRAVYADDAPSPRKKVLVTIFLRGAMDGLNAVVPHGEKAYYALRPDLAIARPDATRESVIDLDGFFGLHPALRPLKPIYDTGHLAMLHAVGSPDPTRSHFEAQDFMESGTPGSKSTSDGWLNRALAKQQSSSPVRAISIGPALPHALRGPNQAVAIDDLSGFGVPDASSAAALEAMYAASRDTVLSQTARDAFDAARRVQAAVAGPYLPGAQYPSSRLGQSLMQIARLIKGDLGLEVAFTDEKGWDHHSNEVGNRPAIGPLADKLADLGTSLAAFYTDLDHRMTDVSVVVMSEFGRTAKQNGSRGTDHGHANVMFVLGGAIKGGKVYGEWPGLEPEQLYEGRDLQVTTDFRDVLAELVVRHRGDHNIEKVFPGYQPRFRGLFKV